MFHKVNNFCLGIVFFVDDKNFEERLILYFHEKNSKTSFQTLHNLVVREDYPEKVVSE